MTRSPSMTAPTSSSRTVKQPDQQTWRGLDAVIDKRQPELDTAR
jgi:hypothetical protein